MIVYENGGTIAIGICLIIISACFLVEKMTKSYEVKKIVRDLLKLILIGISIFIPVTILLYFVLG